MSTADLVVKNCSQLVTCRGPIPKRKDALQDVGIIDDGFIASSRGRIIFVGKEQDFKREIKLEKDSVEIDGRGLTGFPGFVDPHTHLPFAGNRENEFLLRLKGQTYQQLAQQGMGIQTTVKATRKASPQELTELCLKRLDSMLLHGTTTVEAKSGYGLNHEDEIKQLDVLRRLNEMHPVDIVPTFMGAHEIPEEYRGRRDEYIELLTRRVMPEVKRKGLAEFFDIFCEEGVFSLEETRLLVRAAKQAGFKVKIHADEFTPLGGAELAAEEKAVSAEHLINITEAGIAKLAESETAAVLLPVVSFFLMFEKRAPARRLIDRGAVVALATDFNPGSSMTESMLFVLQLAVFTLKMGIEEAVNACTANAAYAIGKHKEVGSLEVGKKMDLILCDFPSFPSIAYHLGINPIKQVIKNGTLMNTCPSSGTEL